MRRALLPSGPCGDRGRPLLNVNAARVLLAWGCGRRLPARPSKKIILCFLPPSKPEEEQKLIYCGKLLLDHQHLQDFLPKVQKFYFLLR